MQRTGLVHVHMAPELPKHILERKVAHMKTYRKDGIPAVVIEALETFFVHNYVSTLEPILHTAISRDVKKDRVSCVNRMNRCTHMVLHIWSFVQAMLTEHMGISYSSVARETLAYQVELVCLWSVTWGIGAAATREMKEVRTCQKHYICI